MARSSLKLTLDQRTPITAPNVAGRPLLRKIIRHLEGVLGGSVQASHISIAADGAQPTAAQAVITAAAAADADTITVGTNTLTALQSRAKAVITFGTSVDNNDTITVNGVVFTAKDADPVAADLEFQNSATAATVAQNFLALFNACTDPDISGIFYAKRSGADVTVYAIEPGTAGNSYTIVSSDGTDLALDTSGTLEGGTARANNKFDTAGNDTHVATDIAYAINNSSTAAVSGNFEACNLSDAITLSTCTAGTGVSIAGHQFFGVSVATSPTNYGEFSIASTDTNDATALKNAINAHPVLCHQVYATSSSGVVTVRQRRGTTSIGKIVPIAKDGVAASGLSVTNGAFTAGAGVLISVREEGLLGNQVAVASSGSTLAVLGSATAFAGGAGGSGTIQRIVTGSTI